MALANATAALKIVGPLAAIVPVFGPQLEALINVANELCGMADGVQSNREGFVNLAREAAVYAAAVADRVQRSHPPVSPANLSELPALADQTRTAESTSLVQVDYSPKHVEALTEILREIEKVVSERKEKDDARAAKFASRFRRALRDTVSKGGDEGTLKDLRTKLDIAVKAFSITADVHSKDMLHRIVEQIEETHLRQKIWLEEEREGRIRQKAEADKRRREEVIKYLEIKLMPVHDARYDSSQAPSGCMANTRVKLLAEIESWIGSEGERVYWLSGLAGTGKSTVARSLCTLLAERRLLAGSFFVSRNSADRRDARSIARTLIFQLAAHFPAVQEHLHAVLVEHPDYPSRPVGDLITHLIVNPLTKISWSTSLPVIVIDAFDECDTQDGREGGSFLPMLLAATRRGTLPLRLFITSRPHPSIKNMFTGTQVSNADSYLSLKLHDIEQSIVQRDIELYLKTSFRRIARTEPELADHTWPEPSALETLVARAGVLFIYAATVVRYVEDPVDVPSERLRILFTQSSPSSGLEYEMLDDLYLQILKGCVGKEKDRNSSLCVRLRMVAGSLVHLQDPLSLASLSALLKIERAAVRRMLENLSSLLIYDPQKPVRLFHPSFPDFIGNADRCNDLRFHLVAEEQHTLLALRCLSVMNHHLTYDICGIGDPSLLNSEVSNLQERLTQSVPAELAYACKHWTTHLSRSSVVYDDALLNELRTFVENHLLHWVEVLSLLTALSSALYGLPGTNSWCRAIGNAAYTMTLLLSDAERTIQEYYTPIGTSALQVYHSALTFMPDCSLHQLAQSTKYHAPRLYTQRHAKWSAILRVLEDHKSVVNCVAFSHDGTRLASCSDDETVRVWDVNTGDVVATFKSHTGGVNSVVFSPDGTLLASGSEDPTVRVRDVNTGVIIAMLKGHTGSVKSVVFSPDGTRLASGSEDTTVRVWDMNTGAVAATLRGHTGSVNSVAFSPSGVRLTSGSDDRAVHVWDLNTGDTAATLNSHTGRVCSVAFSPDGTRIASGSDDTTVRVWSVDSGDAVATFSGHIGYVNSVAFSPDGTRLASGAFDTTVCVSDVSTGDIAATLSSHTGSVNSVAFSPDGTRLASGSNNAAVHLWDVHAGDAIATLNGHNDSVCSLAFSGDGTRLASGSFDRTVRVWDVSTGNVLTTLNGHTGFAHFVVFSPDGARLASGSDDKTVRAWDVNTGDTVATFRGHIGSVTSVAFSPDGTRLASGSDDTTVRIWDIKTGDAVATLEGHTKWVSYILWSLDGSKIMSCDLNGTHHTWDTENYFPIPSHDSADWPTLPITHFTFGIDQQTGWACCTRTTDNYTKRVCWVPSSRRPTENQLCIQTGTRVAMGAPCGAVTFLDLTDWLSTWMSL